MAREEKENYEEYSDLSLCDSWFIIIALCVFLLLSGLLVHRMLPDTERRWNFGALNYTPAASIYSTAVPGPVTVAPAETKKVEKQMEPLPGAQALEKLKPQGYEQGEGLP